MGVDSKDQMRQNITLDCVIFTYMSKTNLTLAVEMTQTARGNSNISRLNKT